MDYIDDPAILGEEIKNLELVISTVDANDASSNDLHWVKIAKQNSRKRLKDVTKAEVIACRTTKPILL